MNAVSVVRADSVSEGIISFLRQHGLMGEAGLFPLPGGANNRVYRIPRTDGDWLLKCYFQNPSDARNRFQAERDFYTWLWDRGIRRTPEPLGWCAEQRLGLFTFVHGRKLKLVEVNAVRVQEALDFVKELNAARDLPAAQAIASGSEACFSLHAHLGCVDQRVARLEKIPSTAAVDRQAAEFVQRELAPAWSRIRESIDQSPKNSNISRDQSLSFADRCLSPSDFGFHNAVLALDGSLRFHDFEYAGWDDPAKLACDFFCQPELPVSHDHWQNFLAQLGAALNLSSAAKTRARLLLPAYQIKWCCIMLNEFVPSEQARRNFAAGTELSVDRKTTQLAKARKSLAQAVEIWKNPV